MEYPFNTYEYISLREEVVKRIEIRQQIVSITLTIAGVILGLGIKNPSLPLFFPPLAAFLAAMWAQNDNRVLQICDYLQLFEGEKSNLNWVTYYKSIQKKKTDFFDFKWSLSVFAPGGMFIVTSIISVGLSLRSISCGEFEWFLRLLDILSIICILILSNRVKKDRQRARSNEAKYQLRIK